MLSVAHRPVSGGARPSMHPQNRPINKALSEIADLLELQLADPVRVRAYRRASKIVAGFTTSVHAMHRFGTDLHDTPGLSEGLLPTIQELAETGSCAMLQRLHADIPRELGALLQIPHLGPQRVRTLHEELGVTSLAELHAAALAGRLQALPSFGPRLEHQLLKAMTAHFGRVRRFRVDLMERQAAERMAWVGQLAHVGRVEIAGDLRRGCDSVAEIDLVAESTHERDVIVAFAAHRDVQEIPFAGRRRIGVVMQDSQRVNLQVAPPECFGAFWLARTGSAAHLAQLAVHAGRRHMTLDETGLARGGTTIAAAHESEIYAALGLPWMPPELREHLADLEAAAAGMLPILVTRADVQGDLHVRSRNGGVEHDLLPLVDAARVRGLRYIAVADPARRQHASRDSDLSRLSRQIDVIDRLNATLTDFVILKSVHADILSDGRLDVPDALLARLDLVMGSVGDAQDLTRKRQTDRLLRAMDNRHFSLLARPTGRLVEERKPYAIDFARVLRHARERGCFMEASGDPARLDLDATGCRAARAAGVGVVVTSGADAAIGLDDLRHGVTQARRGSLRAEDVLNTRPAAALLALLALTMRR